MNATEQITLFGDPVTQWTIDREQLTRALVHNLRHLSLREFVALLTNEYEELIQYAELCAGESACQKTSLLFNPHRLDTPNNSGAPSIFRALQTDSFCSWLARATLFKHGKVKELLYQSIQLGINAVYYTGEFPPAVARDLARDYHLSRNSRVLDPCAGWGGRMIGFSTVVDHYQAFEPSTRTHDGLQRLAQWLQQFRPEFSANVECMPFEDGAISLLESSYDFALTSPPYFDTELYSDEKTNSCNRYKTFAEWRDGFYHPMIDGVMRALKPGAAFVLNIGSRKYPLNDSLRELPYNVRKLEWKLSGAGGLGRSGEGETFYEVTHK